MKENKIRVFDIRCPDKVKMIVLIFINDDVMLDLFFIKGKIYILDSSNILRVYLTDLLVIRENNVGIYFQRFC